MPSLRFEDEELQRRFTESLRENGLPFRLDTDSAVQFDEKDRSSINAVAHTIRDSCFKWYFSWGSDPETAKQLESTLRSKGMPFQIEHHEDGKVFLLPKADEEKHQEIIAAID